LLIALATAQAQDTRPADDAIEGVPSQAPRLDESPDAVLARPPPLAAKNYWVPAVEIIGQQLVLNLGARAMGEDYAMISPATAWNNLTGPWWFDEDSLLTNEIGHPLQGAFYFTAARSSRLGFWGARAYTAMGSLTWEYLWETEPPSINDQITTTIGGILVGETMYRLSLAMWQRDRQQPSLLRTVGAGLLDPMSTLNRGWLGFRAGPVLAQPSWSVFELGPGPFVSASVFEQPRTAVGQVQLAAAVTYGLPGRADFQPRAPFEHFDARVEVAAAPDAVLGSMFARGLVVGDDYGNDKAHGIWGLFLSQDFLSRGTVRVGSFGVGLGTSAQLRLGEQGFLMGTAMLSAVPIGAAGHRVGEGLRDYELGPGSSQLLELRLGRVDTGMITSTSRTVEIFGLPFEGLSHTVGVSSLDGQLRIWRSHALGLKLEGYTAEVSRQADSARTDGALQAMVMYTLLSDRSFGAATTEGD